MKDQPKFNELGPIAESYETLQSIIELEEAFSSRPDWVCDIEEATTRTVLQCLHLLHRNCADLCERQLNHRFTENLGSPEFIHHTAWHLELTRYAIRLAEHLLALPSNFPAAGNHLGSAARSHFNAYNKSCSSFSNVLRYPKRQLIELSINGCLSNPTAFLIHSLKNLYLSVSILVSRLVTLPVNPKYLSDYDDHICASALDRAVYDLKIRGDTYFTQFRVLHQVPELLARVVHERINGPLAKCKSSESALWHMGVISEQYGLIVDSVRPMLSLMLPQSYHKIRRNLGMTSGSKSIQLRRFLLGEDVEAIQKTVDRLASKRRASGRYLRRELAKIQVLAVTWRDLHLGLPRNVLGAPNTRSLINSHDAVNVPLKWRNIAAAGYSGYLSQFSRDFLLHCEALEGAKALDEIILKESADLTQKKFPEVQDRYGRFSSDPK